MYEKGREMLPQKQGNGEEDETTKRKRFCITGSLDPTISRVRSDYDR
jgi:hypothetical protein